MKNIVIILIAAFFTACISACSENISNLTDVSENAKRSDENANMSAVSVPTPPPAITTNNANSSADKETGWWDGGYIGGEIVTPTVFDKSMTEFMGNAMYLYGFSKFKMDGEMATVEMYAYGIVIEADGLPMRNETGGNIFGDDTSIWSLFVRRGDYVYTILSGYRIHLGSARYYLWHDFTNEVHVILIEQWGSRISIYDFAYDTQIDAFVKNKIYNTKDVNGFAYSMN